MKKEFIALSVIAAILVFSIVNAHYVRSRAADFSDEIRAAQQLCAGGEDKRAAKSVSDSLDGWLEWRKYAHIMLRHSEVDGVTEAYYDLLAELQSSKGETAPAAFSKVEQKLRNIADMEQMSIGSIL